VTSTFASGSSICSSRCRTLGLYSPWAKVRKAKYFTRNTRLDGHVFDYHGNPVAILRGRLLAFVLVAAYTWAFQFSTTAGLVTVAALGVAGPWLFMRAQQFAPGNTSFRGLRFGFRAVAFLRSQRLSARALHSFFDRVRRRELGRGGRMPEFASTQPSTQERLDRFRREIR